MWACNLARYTSRSPRGVSTLAPCNVPTCAAIGAQPYVAQGEAETMRGCLFVALMLMANVAFAQQTDDDRARMHFQSGMSYYEQARYDEAAREFVEAYALSQRPALLLNLSQAYERDLKFAEAIAELQRYLEAVPDSPQRRTVESRIARMGELQARVNATQSAEADPAETAASEPEVAPEPAPVTESAPAASPNSAPSHGASVSIPGVILASVGGLMIAGSIVTGVMAHSTHTDLEERCPGGECPASENAQGDIDSGRTLAWVSTGLLAGGVVTAAIGAVLLLVGGGDETPPVAAAFLLAPGEAVGMARIAF